MFIPINKTIKKAVDNFFSSNVYQGKLSKSELCHFLEREISESSVIFDNMLYKQMMDLLWVRFKELFWQIHSYVLSKNFGLKIVNQNSDLLDTEDMQSFHF